MKQYKTEFKNIFTTYPELTKIMYHINHYISNMNKSKTGIFYLHNLEVLLFNILCFKNLIKHSSKKAEDILYYPFSGKFVLQELEEKLEFKDFKNNEFIKQIFEEKRVENLVKLINKNIKSLNESKHSKEDLLDCFSNIEKYLWVMYTCYKLYADEYEKMA